MTKEEKDKFDTLEQEIKDLDATIEAEKRARDYEIKDNDKQDGIAEERAEAEERAFECYIRGIVEERTNANMATVNMATSDNGAVMPSSIANKIISKVYDISPIYQLATRYNVGGTLNIPYYDESTQSQGITNDYATEIYTYKKKK